MRTVKPGHAASAHFAGTLPMTNRDEPLTTDRNGKPARYEARLHRRWLGVPDAAGKGLTFTMMANANRIGVGVSRDS